ncbi:MAG: histidine kinase [Saprospiraceae bacterium]
MSNGYGQFDQKDFVHYTITEGLSDNNVSCISQDSRGFIWVGTEFGLNRFDGYQFEKYYQGSPRGFLTSSTIHQLSSFSSDRLAVLTRNGMQIVHTNDLSITQYQIPDTTPFKVMLNYFVDAMEFRDNTIGAATATGFYIFDSMATLLYRHDAFMQQDVGNKRISYGKKIINVPEDKALIYAIEDLQGVYDIKNKSYRDVSASEKEWQRYAQPSFYGWRAITQLSDHDYIFLTRQDSLIYYDGQREKQILSGMSVNPKYSLTWESNVFMIDDTTYLVNSGYNGFYKFYFDRSTGIIRYDPQVYLKEYKVRCFYKDKDNRIWVGTTEGLLKQKSTPAITQIYHWPVNDVSRLGYSNALVYKEIIYVSRFSRDTGLIVVDPQTMQVQKKFSFFGQNNPYNEIYTMQMYYPDTLWLGTNGGLLWLDTKSERYGKVDDMVAGGNNAEWAILTPPQKDQFAWMCDFLDGHVARYHIPTRQWDFYDSHTQPALPFLQVKSLCTDAYGDTWLGGHSLAKWNHTDLKFDLLLTSYGGPNPYEDDIKLLRADQQGSLWLHNFGNGLLRYKIKTGEWLHFGLNEGMPSEAIQSMSIIRDHTFWMTCQNQLIRFDTETGKIESYDQSDGVPEIKPVAPNMYVDTISNNLYVFYRDDVVVLPFDFHPNTTSAADLLIQQVLVNNKKAFFFPQKVLMLGTQEKTLTLHFTVVDFHEGQPYRFAYRMNDQDEWTSLGHQRMLNLTNLSPGSYTIEIAATSKSGIRKTNTLSFSIAPPFWATAWFIIACIIMLTGFTYLLYRRRLAQFQQKANLDKLISQTEMKALHAQMNPHFIFNSLNSIREMILNNETHEASKFLGNFAHLIRITLDQSRQSFISLRHTMDYLNRYIDMEKIRNPDFHFSMEVDRDLEPDETILPPLLIQPFIENAIWHGQNGEDQEINILVQFKKRDAYLVCLIEDDGIGIEQSLKKKNGKNSSHTSVSIANIQKRLELLNRKHDLRSSIALIDKREQDGYSGTGTIVRITLPLEIKEE